jgi:hypothetical protein
MKILRSKQNPAMDRGKCKQTEEQEVSTRIARQIFKCPPQHLLQQITIYGESDSDPYMPLPSNLM